MDRIEITVDRHPEILGLSARVGTKVFPFTSSKWNSAAALRLTTELRKAWEKEGTLRGVMQREEVGHEKKRKTRR